MVAVLLSSLLLSATSALADKPVWAGNGGKPTKEEKNHHKKEMTSKHKNKEKDSDDDSRKREKEQSKNYRDGDKKSDRDRSKNDDDYEGKNKSDAEYINEKTDEAKKKLIKNIFDTSDK